MDVLDVCSIKIQKMVRRFLVRCMIFKLNDLILLRRAIVARDVNRISELLFHIQTTAIPLTRIRNDPVLMRIYEEETSAAVTMLKFYSTQDSFLQKLRLATDTCSVDQLNKLLVQLHLYHIPSTHQLAIEAKECLLRMLRKRDILVFLIKCLQNPEVTLRNSHQLVSTRPPTCTSPPSSSSAKLTPLNHNCNNHSAILSDNAGHTIDESGDSIASLIHEARCLDIDEDIIREAENVIEDYRANLTFIQQMRQAIEYIDVSQLSDLCDRAIQIRKNQHTSIGREYVDSGFAEVEIRAAKKLLKMLEFDKQLDETAYSCSEACDEQLPKLSVEVRHVCDLLSASGSHAQSADSSMDSHQGRYHLSLKRRLYELCKEKAIALHQAYQHHSRTVKEFSERDIELELERAIRYYKWSKVVSVWNYPEVQQTKNNSSNESFNHTSSKQSRGNKGERFFGLDMDRVTSSWYIIRTLHQAADPIQGFVDVPSLQSALSGLHLKCHSSLPFLSRTSSNTNNGHNSALKMSTPGNLFNTNSRNESNSSVSISYKNLPQKSKANSRFK